MVKIVEEVVEEVDDVDEDLDESSSDDSEEEDLEDSLDDIGGIFDEDLSDDSISDFDIGDTMLTVSPAVESWSGQNLEQELSREWIKKDWGDEEEFVSGDFYKNEDSGSFYGRDSSSSFSYKGANQLGDFYNNDSGSNDSDVYNTGRSSKKGGSGAYMNVNNDFKSYEDNNSNRRGEKSVLEMVGYDDKSKKGGKDLREDFMYDNRNAA